MMSVVQLEDHVQTSLVCIYCGGCDTMYIVIYQKSRLLTEARSQVTSDQEFPTNDVLTLGLI
jgi:hypothetical protein